MGSTENNSSMETWSPLPRVKGADGLATPNRTGAMRAFAVSHNSSMEITLRAAKTLLQRVSGYKKGPHFPNKKLS
jgi:hypothetical protein